MNYRCRVKRYFGLIIPYSISNSFTMKRLHSKYLGLIVLLIAVAVLIVSLFVIYSPVLEHTGGIIAYPVDDAYIHLAIAKNLAIHHIWGVSPYEFSSSSSSILYPILLAAVFMSTGVHIGTPLFLNAIIAILFLSILQRWLVRQMLTPLQQLVVLLAAVFLIPLPPLVQCGMEHTLQLLFYFLFVYSIADALEHREMSIPWKVYVYGALFTATRYESMAVIAIACLFLLFYRRWVPAFLLGTISFLPVLIFGLYARSKGSDFLPNSVLLKSAMPSLTFDGLYSYFTDDFGMRLFKGDIYNTFATQRLLFLLPLTYLLFLRHTVQRPAYRYILILLMVASLLHVSLMLYSLSPRYEAALIGSSVIICLTILLKNTPLPFYRPLSGPEWIKVLLACFIVAPIVLRGWNAFERASLASICIYDQQVQMGRFAQEFYDRDAIAINDIGAVSYFAHGHNLDLWGLSDVDIARSRRKHYNSPDFLDSLSHRRQVKIAIVFEQPFHDLLKRWSRMASWTIPYNNASYSKTVFFYAVDPAEEQRLSSSLKEFQPSLPKGVIVNYY